MDVAVWDDLPLELFSGEEGRSGSPGVHFQPVSRRDAASRLFAGSVDAALLPTLSVLQNTDAFDVLPAVAFSSWNYPYARLSLRGGLGGKMSSLAFETGADQEALIARIILREHYQARVSVQEVAAGDPKDIFDADADAHVFVSSDAWRVESDRFEMDLGREWYELANYPMVWGVFAMLKDASEPGHIVALREAIAAAEDGKERVAAGLKDPVLEAFVRDHLRLRLDNLAIASLTEFCNYVYYYGAVPDFATVPFVSLPDEDEADDADDLPLV